PVQLFAATEEHPVRLHEIHTADSGRVEHRRFGRVEGREIPYEEVGRGFAMPDGNVVPLTDEDLARLPLPTKRVIEVLGFVPGQDIDPISYDKPYFAGPNGPGADRPYVLLVEALAGGTRSAAPRQPGLSSVEPTLDVIADYIDA
ncbi:Ku protein, partial [Streptomyces sp. NPDC059970]|uniref:Ku protein n=1 Tax=Streptomyces sp. NPDC059970 TaxID=3347019 RepID=UPI0036A19249